MMYLDVWRSGRFLENPQVSALPIANKDHRTTEHSTSDSLGNVSWVQKPLYNCTEGMYHSQEVRRPGYEASSVL